MKQEKQTINTLLTEFEDYLISLKRNQVTIRQYKSIWKLFREYAKSNHIKFYDHSVGDRFIKSVLGNYEYSTLNQIQRRLVNTINALYLFKKEGALRMGNSPLKRKLPREFEGEIGVAMQTFVNFKKTTFNLARTTVNTHCRSLHLFLYFLTSNGVNTVTGINHVYIFSFIKSLPSNRLAVNHTVLGVVKAFFQYVFEEKLVSTDYSKIIQRDNYKQQPKLPSVFSAEEIKTLLHSIDRANASGKRAYAIILLATKLGMRSGDIAGLRFENINWEKGFIHFNQMKTGKEIILPLLPEVGNAIIDYLKHGRPKSDLSICFLQTIGPYKAITSSDVGGIVQYQMQRANINTKSRKHGPHALRHSFATNLLQNKTLLPVISEALGHAHTESTMCYLRVDKDQLRQCALQVPLVPSSFYNHKGGFKP